MNQNDYRGKKASLEMRFKLNEDIYSIRPILPIDPNLFTYVDLNLCKRAYQKKKQPAVFNGLHKIQSRRRCWVFAAISISLFLMLCFAVKLRFE